MIRRCRVCHECRDDNLNIVNIDKETDVALELSEIGAYTCYKCSVPFIVRAAQVVLRQEMGMMPTILKDCSIQYGVIGDKIQYIGIPTKEDK
jgi:hypothetical protein